MIRKWTINLGFIRFEYWNRAGHKSKFMKIKGFGFNKLYDIKKVYITLAIEAALSIALFVF